MAFTFDLMINIVYPMLFGGLGGVLTAIYKYKGELEMPTFLILQTKTLIRLGFMKEVFFGAGAGTIAANLFYAINTMPPTLVGGIVAAFAGLAGAKYLFKNKGETRTMDGEVNDLVDFLNNNSNDDEEE